MPADTVLVVIAVLAMFGFFTVLLLWATNRAEPAFPGSVQRPPAPRQAGRIDQAPKSSGPVGAH